MSSIAPSKTSKGSKASRISKKDRDLEMMAVMAPAIQKRTAENRDIEELTFHQLTCRVIGGFNLVVAMILFIIAAVIYTISCCGSQTQYDKTEFEEQCQTAADEVSGEGTGQWSCYYRNLSVLITFCFALYLTIVGITILVGAEIFYATGYTQNRQEGDLEDLAHELKAQKLNDRLEERENRRIEREEREYAREARREERRASRQLAPAPAARPSRTNRYAGAAPYAGGLQRAHSVGAPSNITYQTYQTGAPVTYRMQAQPTTQYVYGGNSRAISPSRIQIRTSREGAVYNNAPSPLRIRVSAERPAPSSPGRRTVINHY